MSDAGCGSGTLRLRRKISLLFGEKSFETVCSDSLILKPALKRARSVCLSFLAHNELVASAFA
jgi:hypothetical protein